MLSRRQDARGRRGKERDSQVYADGGDALVLGQEIIIREPQKQARFPNTRVTDKKDLRSRNPER